MWLYLPNQKNELKIQVKNFIKLLLLVTLLSPSATEKFQIRV